MDRSVCQLTGAFVDAVEPGDDPAVLSLGIVGVHSSQRRNRQMSVGFYLRDHSPKSIHMGLQEHSIVCFLSPKICENAAFYGFLRSIA